MVTETFLEILGCQIQVTEQREALKQLGEKIEEERERLKMDF